MSRIPYFCPLPHPFPLWDKLPYLEQGHNDHRSTYLPHKHCVPGSMLSLKPYNSSRMWTLHHPHAHFKPVTCDNQQPTRFFIKKSRWRSKARWNSVCLVDLTAPLAQEHSYVWLLAAHPVHVNTTHHHCSPSIGGPSGLVSLCLQGHLQ